VSGFPFLEIFDSRPSCLRGLFMLASDSGAPCGILNLANILVVNSILQSIASDVF